VSAAKAAKSEKREKNLAIRKGVVLTTDETSAGKFNVSHLNQKTALIES
jgi:hypothetical protein